MTITRTNLLQNPSSETTAALSVATGCTLAREVASAFAGTAVTKMTASATAPAATTPAGTSGVPVVGSRTYVVSAYVRHAAAAARQLAVQVIWYTSAGAVIATTGAAFTSVPNTDVWTRLSTVQYSPSTAAYAAVRVSGASVVAAEVFRWDALMVERADFLDSYFDGSTAASGIKSYGWAGSANASASQEHSATFTATPVPDRGAVALVLDDAPPAWNGNLVGVSRSVDSGPSVAVRLQPGINIGYLESGKYTLTDFDVPASAAGKPIVYTLSTSTGGMIATAPVSLTPGASVLPWTYPERVLPVPLITSFRHTRTTTDVVHDILGATNPAVTIGDGRPASGSMDLWCATLADAQALEYLLLLDSFARGGVYLLRGPVGDPWRLFFKPRSVDIEPAAEWAPAGASGLRWLARVEFTTMPEQTGPRS